VPSSKLSGKDCGECMITLSRSGAHNLAILSLCLCVRPAAVVLCLQFLIAILQSVLLVQHARPGKHSKFRCCVSFKSFFALLFIVSFHARRSMIERCL